MFLYEIQKGEAKISAAYGYDSIVEIPETIEGYPVTELLPYSFSSSNPNIQKKETEELMLTGENITQIFLPSALKKIGNYAFYNCRRLRKICLYSTVTDIGTGVFTGCGEIEELKIQIKEDTRSCLKEILSEIPNQMLVWYESQRGKAKLIFPEYFEEAIENTPARILLTQTHGCGHRYRYCFEQTKFLFREYDKLFSYVKRQEEEDLVIELALGRLYYPLELTEQAKKEYIGYIKEFLIQAAKIIIKREDANEIMWFAKEFLTEQGILDEVINSINQENNAIGLSILMDFRHKNFKGRIRKFEL